MRTKLLIAALLLGMSPPAFAAGQDVPISMPSEAPSGIFSGSRSSDVLAAQILLDHSRHSPGVIDGVMGGNTKRAIRSYQRVNGLTVTGALSSDLLQSLKQKYSGALVQRYKLTEEDVSGPFVEIPEGFIEQAKLEHLAYESAAEKIAEKFHMSQEFLEALNPGADFSSAGTQITVIVPGDDRVSGTVARIEVDKGKAALRAYAEDGKLLATYPATVGSSNFPSPSGSMTVRAIAAAPTYHFDPKNSDWGPDKAVTIAAGPNNPVGSTWIDLTKDGYGIHGTPEPQLIGKTSSHGCVRLTNWDAAELARAVSQGVAVEFVT